MRSLSALTVVRARWVLWVAAAVVFAASWAVASQSYFFADDFLIGKYLIDNPLDAQALMRTWFGHLMPGYILADGLFVRLFGLSWPLASVIISLVNVGAFVALVRALDAVIGRIRLNPLIGLAFSLAVGVLATRLWWAASLNNMLALALSLAALGSLTRWVTLRRWPHLVGTLTMFAAALAVSEKTLLFSVYAAAWCVFVVWRGLGVTERAKLFLRAWPAWIGIAALCSIDLYIFASGSYIEDSGAAPGFTDSVVFVLWGIVGGLIPSFFGMDLVALDPGWAPAGIIISALLLGGVIVFSVVRQRALAGVWIFVALAAILSTSVLSRRSELIGFDGGRVLRYHLETTALFWLATGVVVYTLLTARQPVRAAAAPDLPRRLVVIGLMVACIASAAVWVPSVISNLRGHPGIQARNWVEQIGKTYPSDQRPPFLDVTVPEFVVFSGLAPYDRADAVLPFAFPGSTTTDQLEGSWTVDDDGNAGPAVFLPDAHPVVVNRCDTGMGIDVHETAGARGEFLVIDFDQAEPGSVYLDVGELTSREVTTTSGRLVVELSAALPRGKLHFDSEGRAFCIRSVSVGDIVPAPVP
jgi:hypothetical protein